MVDVFIGYRERDKDAATRCSQKTILNCKKSVKRNIIVFHLTVKLRCSISSS